MTQYIPITLVGGNLGERHRHLNFLVNDAYQRKTPFSSVQDLHEQTAIDRLFKIDLASKCRNVCYILKNLKDDDMLYVSRALKCTWLLEAEYHDIINPTHLEDTLFPRMLTTAVNKMKHWIHLHLKDTERCQEFYQYYSSKDLDLAIKFFWNCSCEFIEHEFINLLEKITPQHLKLLCEKCPQAVRVFFDNLSNNQALISKYVHKQKTYYNSLKCLLKINPNLFLDITEKYFEHSLFKRFSSPATLFIMSNHRDRFNKKPELYTAWLLDIKTLAKCLGNDEVKDVILKLARAEYLSDWFTYKNIEPLIKSLSFEERSSFKKLIFVDKSIGAKVKNWPYSIPCSPSSGYHRNIFLDTVFRESLVCYTCSQKRTFPRSLRDVFRGRCCCYAACPIKTKTFLDQIFDRYRFVSFETTFFELRRKLTAESSTQNREYMMLVLVSKSGGRLENVEELLKLLVSRHKNEPANLRAAVIRSLVKRAAVWRLPEPTWLLLVEFGHGLGLDGSEPEAACAEGLHAVVLRDILLAGTCLPALLQASVNEFPHLVVYKLNASEKRQVIEHLPRLFLAAIAAEPQEAIRYLNILICLLLAYHVRVDTCAGILPAIVTLYHRDHYHSRDILQKLFDMKVARKQLYRENFTFIQTNASYLNILRHDSSLLESTDQFQELVQKKLCHDGFLKKIAIYFTESNGLAERYRCILEKEIIMNPRVKLGRSMSLLAGSSFLKRLRSLDGEPTASEQRRLAAAMRANAHLCRPSFDLDTIGWHAAGVKAVVNKISICKIVDIKEHLQHLLPWPCFAKLALILAQRINQEAAAFVVVASTRPTVAIKIALRYILLHNADCGQSVWRIVKPLIGQADLSKLRFENLRKALRKVDSLPNNIKNDFYTIIFSAAQKSRNSLNNTTHVVSSIERELPVINETFIEENIVKNLLENELIATKIIDDSLTNTYIRIIAKYLLLSRSEDAQKNRLTIVCEPLLSRMETLLEVSKKRPIVMSLLKTFIVTLKYNTVFFDATYVCCIPVFERILEWMRRVVPVTHFFGMHCTIRLTMIYFKSIRESIKHNPTMFADQAKKENEGVEIVGKVFGKHLSREVSELISKYFDSILLAYAPNLYKYFSYNFIFCESRDRFICALAAGFLDTTEGGKSRVLVVKSFLDCGMHIYVDSSTTQKKLFALLMAIDSSEAKFFLHSLTKKNVPT